MNSHKLLVRLISSNALSHYALAFTAHKNMSNIIVGNGASCRPGTVTATTATTIALILILMASPAILTTTTQAYATPLESNNDCKDMEFRSFRSNSFYSTQVDNRITLITTQNEYPMKIDYFRDSGEIGRAHV